MLDRAQVLHVARLARLELSEAEVDQMAAELSKVLDHVEQIRELDLEGVSPTSHVIDVAGVVRADEPEPSLTAEVALASAPEPVDARGRVERVAGHGRRGQGESLDLPRLEGGLPLLPERRARPAARDGDEGGCAGPASITTCRAGSARR